MTVAQVKTVAFHQHCNGEHFVHLSCLVLEYLVELKVLQEKGILFTIMSYVVAVGAAVDVMEATKHAHL